MVKYYYFNEEITADSVNNLIDRLENIENKIVLYFSTIGGDPCAMQCLIDFLNNRKENISIVLTNQVCSAGTTLLTDFKGELKLDVDNLDFLLFHLADRESYNLRKTQSKELKKQDIEYNKNFAKKLKEKQLLTKKQLKRFFKGEDVCVYKKQFKLWKICTIQK